MPCPSDTRLTAWRLRNTARFAAAGRYSGTCCGEPTAGASRCPGFWGFHSRSGATARSTQSVPDQPTSGFRCAATQRCPHSLCSSLRYFARCGGGGPCALALRGAALTGQKSWIGIPHRCGPLSCACLNIERGRGPARSYLRPHPGADGTHRQSPERAVTARPRLNRGPPRATPPDLGDIVYRGMDA